jgi:hypothetical protein
MQPSFLISLNSTQDRNTNADAQFYYGALGLVAQVAVLYHRSCSLFNLDNSTTMLKNLMCVHSLMDIVT